MRWATVVPAEVLAVGRQRILVGARLGETTPEHSSVRKSGSILAVAVSEGRQPRAFGRGGACVQPERTQPRSGKDWSRWFEPPVGGVPDLGCAA
ncbi:putative proline-rich receptor-like protein kinase PERK2 [Iris pallida]|uniref:Proline-rich receptor-like protein kinase PERK2 n=1 Tax=Iris pallida TaxID=29817 RepID=A0AAX6EN48_IRIPA|nr:putative proline-rich receptor-like protein kinase PERK2 [Iris pallida]